MVSTMAADAPARARGRRSAFYVGLSVLITAIVLAGFGPSFVATVIRGEPRPLIVHVHAAVYLGWLALLIAQTVLAARGRIDLHRRLGELGIYYAVLVFLLGVTMSLVVPALHVRAGEWTLDRAASFLTIPLGDMVLFAGFFGAGIAYRRKPEVHKRLVVLACVAVMFAAVGRLWFVESIPVLLTMWLLPVLVAIGYDVVKRGRVHPVYLIGVVVMAAAILRIPFGQSELWRRVGRALVGVIV